MAFLGEIKRRKVFHVALVYAAVAWLLVEIVATVEEPLNLPGWADTLIIVLLAVGFPIAIVLAWAFQISPDGIIRTQVALDGGSSTVEGSPGPGTEDSPRRSTTTQRAAIAVLPFDNISRDAEQEYFADGLTEDLITALSRWRSFSVIARNSSFAYKGKSPDIREVADHLGVRYVLEGSVRTVGDRVRISAQLIDGTTGDHVWAEKYDRKLENFFDVQDEITQAIAAKVEPEFVKAEQKRVAQKPSTNLASWECYQRGVAAYDEVTKEGYLRARDFLERAIELDPGSSRPYAGMAYCLFKSVLDGFSEAGDEDSAKIIEYAKRAVALDEADALAHHTLALSLLYFSGNHDLAIAEGSRAVSLNPSFSQAHVPLGNALSFSGKPEEGIAHLKEALRLNPEDIRGFYYWTYLGEAHLNNRDYEQAVECARTGLERSLGHAYPYFVLASALGHLGQIEDARAALAECLSIKPTYPEIHRQLHTYQNPADREHILEGLRKAGWSEE